MNSRDGRIDARDWSLLGVLAILWGGSFFFNGVALKELPPLTLVFLRVAIAATILLPLLWALSHQYAAKFGRLEAVRCARALQQRASVFPDRDRADLRRKRAGVDPERNHPVVHGGRDGGFRRGKTVRPPPCRRHDRPRRRRHPARRFWL